MLISKIKIINSANEVVEEDIEYDQNIFDSYLYSVNKDKSTVKMDNMFTTDDLNIELWKSIDDIPKDIISDTDDVLLYEEIRKTYYVSNLGRVMKFIDNKYILIKVKNEYPYREIRLINKDIRIHRLVGYLYCKNNNYKLKTSIDHIDHNNFNNYFNNLRWVMPVENSSNIREYDTSKCAHADSPANHSNPNRNKGPKVKLSLDGLQLIKVYNSVKDLQEEYSEKEIKLIRKCCNSNLKNNTNKYNSLMYKWMFYDHYIEYYSNENNEKTHYKNKSNTNSLDNSNVNIEDILKLKVIDKNNYKHTYDSLNITDEQLETEEWRFIKFKDGYELKSRADFILKSNEKSKRYFVSNLGRIASYIDGELILKSAIKRKDSNTLYVSLFNKIYSIPKLYKMCFK